jgi:hypothetical protein
MAKERAAFAIYNAASAFPFFVLPERLAKLIQQVPVLDLAAFCLVLTRPERLPGLRLHQRNARVAGGHRILHGRSACGWKVLALGNLAHTRTSVQPEDQVGFLAASRHFKMPPLAQLQNRRVFQLDESGLILDEHRMRVDHRLRQHGRLCPRAPAGPAQYEDR